MSPFRTILLSPALLLAPAALAQVAAPSASLATMPSRADDPAGGGPASEKHTCAGSQGSIPGPSWAVY